ncbi:MAG: type II toxin-antitoxin system RelE/ParE family toxin [Rhodospirillaceae bacterium]|nr:type II toxin-antitoxin system RelE/ParE family toxin [Rhodospirillaceae bacterium]
MIAVRRTALFADWLSRLRDARIDRLALGNPGDVKPVGQGVSELRIDYGPGYRVYFVQRRNGLIVLLCGGDKSTQAKDVKTAISLAAQLED